MALAASMARPKRWDRPFGGDMTDDDVDRALALPLLSTIDADAFPKSQRLRDIIRFDSRISEYKRGDIVVRQGDYGHSVFIPISGAMRVLIETPPEIQRAEPALSADSSRNHGLGFWEALKQGWSKPKFPEVRDVSLYQQTNTSVRSVGSSGEAESRSYIKDVDKVNAACKTVQIKVGDDDMVGEIAALTRGIRTATIYADEDSVLLEMRWQGLRDVRNRDAGFRAFIDERYRQRALISQLRSLPLFVNLSDDVLEEISKQTKYETYGDFEWNRTFQKTDSRDSDSVIDKEPILAQQGHYPNDLIVISSGFGRVSELLDNKERTIDYLDQSALFGLEEITANWRRDENVPFQRTLRAIGYLDVLRIPVPLVEKYVLPTIPEEHLPELVIDDENPWLQSVEGERIDQELVDFFIDNRTINGTRTMLVNTDRCVNCDDCVRGCAAAHDNNPRFLRHGPKKDNIMVANACMHCVDPVCLIGCPTGAIGRHQSTGNVIINDLSCIGCGTCAASCPYDNIRLVEVRDESGAFIVDEGTREPIVKATKCDLCQDQLTGPACQQACPHDALIRMDMRDRDSLTEWLCRQ